MACSLQYLYDLYHKDINAFNDFCKDVKPIYFYNNIGSIKYLINTMFIELWVKKLLIRWNFRCYVKHIDPDFDLYYGDEPNTYSDEPDLLIADLGSGDECTVEVKHFYNKHVYNRTIAIYQLWFETHSMAVVRANYGERAYIKDHNADCMMFVCVDGDKLLTTYMNNDGKIIDSKSLTYDNNLDLLPITNDDKLKQYIKIIY